MHCSRCGTENPDEFQFCQNCGTSLSKLVQVIAKSQPGVTVSVELRQAILEQAIQKYVARGYQVISRTETTAQLVKPKHLSCLALIVLLGLSLLLVGIILLIVYLLWYAVSKPESVYLEVDALGRLRQVKR